MKSREDRSKVMQLLDERDQHFEAMTTLAQREKKFGILADTAESKLDVLHTGIYGPTEHGSWYEQN